jgi:hypothetical protein
MTKLVMEECHCIMSEPSLLKIYSILSMLVQAEIVIIMKDSTIHPSRLNVSTNTRMYKRIFFLSALQRTS